MTFLALALALARSLLKFSPTLTRIEVMICSVHTTHQCPIDICMYTMYVRTCYRYMLHDCSQVEEEEEQKREKMLFIYFKEIEILESVSKDKGTNASYAINMYASLNLS